MSKSVKIAIIGLGLIGGSLLKALNGKVDKLIGVSRSEQTVQTVLKEGLADVASTDFNIVSEADIVFICTPINSITSTIDKVAKIVHPDCIITDGASLKGFIVEHVNNLPYKINFIGGHPMAGTENKGISSAVDSLFIGAKWVLTPVSQTTEQDIYKLKEVIKLIGAIPMIADPYEHDKAVALISHMPMLVSQSLFHLLNNYRDKNVKELAFKLASSGFRDMTRLACSNLEMAGDMVNLNRENIREGLKVLSESIEFLEQNFDLNDENFSRNFETLIHTRKDMYDKEGKNIIK